MTLMTFFVAGDIHWCGNTYGGGADVSDMFAGLPPTNKTELLTSGGVEPSGSHPPRSPAPPRPGEKL